MVDISVIVPVYNSADIVSEFNLKISEALQHENYELILVNDYSSDNSWDVIKEVSLVNKHIQGVNFRKNFGQDNAIMAGLRHASGNYMVIMDDDLQHSPFDILPLINQLKKGADVCYANFNKKNQKWWKNLGSWLNGKVAEVILDKPKDIYLSPFFAMDKGVVSEIIKYDGSYPYIPGLVFRTTSNITQISVSHYIRFSGKSNFNFKKSFTVFLKFATSCSVKPLRFSSLVGIFCSLIGFCLIPYYLYIYLSGEVIEGWTTLVVIILILGGLILVSLGVVGEYLGRMYLSINKKPQYVIKEEINENSEYSK